MALCDKYTVILVVWGVIVALNYPKVRLNYHRPALITMISINYRKSALISFNISDPGQRSDFVNEFNGLSLV